MLVRYGRNTGLEIPRTINIAEEFQEVRNYDGIAYLDLDFYAEEFEVVTEGLPGWPGFLYMKHYEEKFNHKSKMQVSFFIDERGQKFEDLGGQPERVSLYTVGGIQFTPTHRDSKAPGNWRIKARVLVYKPLHLHKHHPWAAKALAELIG